MCCVVPAGLTHTPRSEKAEMSFSLTDMETYLPYTKALREFLALYNDDKQRDQMKYEDCGGGFFTRDLRFLPQISAKISLNPLSSLPSFLPDEPGPYKERGDLESETGIRRACRFPRSLLGPCSGIEDPEFGFKEGKPCLIVKLNRIVNFRPRASFF